MMKYQNIKTLISGRSRDAKFDMKQFLENKYNQEKIDVTKLIDLLIKKQERGLKFSLEELNFLYEIDNKIEKKDPRIEQIKQQRNLLEDLSFIFKVPTNEIATKLSDF